MEFLCGLRQFLCGLSVDFAPGARRKKYAQSAPLRWAVSLFALCALGVLGGKEPEDIHMLIPAIDLRGGKVVQLIQGERLAIETTDLDYWIERFSDFPRVNVIDLDAAMNLGSNDLLVREICGRLPSQVGGGVRSPERALELCRIGAKKIIVGSALFKDGRADIDNAKRFSDAVGVERIIGAVDSKAGRVVTHGWKSATATTAVEAVRALEPYCGEFLYTHVDNEGLMKGTDIAAIRNVCAATRRRLMAAGGVTTQAEVDELDALGIDAVVGMAIYTGALKVRLKPDTTTE